MATGPKRKTKTQKRPRKKPLDEKHIIGFLFVTCLLLTAFLGGTLFFFEWLNIPDLRNVSHYNPPQATLIYDRHSRIVGKIYKENRTVVTLDQMHPLLPKAFVAAEDGRFFEHPGLDSFSVLRAVINNFKSGSKRQGGSTITQQVAKGLLLTPEKTYLRKLKEAILAWRIDSMLSKEEIIFIYLNHIYLGEGTYGVEAASQFYFDKHSEDLSLGEAALLAGLPQAPSRYSPLDHWDRARARQRYVLNRMAADGYITTKQAKQAYEKKVRLTGNLPSKAHQNGYYIEEVRKRVGLMVPVRLDTAGLKIYTNLDQRIQTAAQKAVVKAITDLSSRSGKAKKTGKKPQAAFVCIEGCSGKVRALSGGSNYKVTPFNRATQAKRPAGSVFKPLVYTTAFEKGYRPDSTILDTPFSIAGRDGEVWAPKNFSGRYHGTTTLAQSLIHSYNIPAVKLMQQIGITPVVNMARDLEINAEFPPDLSLALGAVDLSLLEISNAYQPFICNGVFHPNTLISRIVSARGETIYRAKEQKKRVMSVQTADQLNRLLSRVVREGTGRRIKGLDYRKTGGKTGTSDNNRDAWFIGFHGSYIGGVWIGYDKNQSLGKHENGGRTAAPIWASFMKQIAQ